MSEPSCPLPLPPRNASERDIVVAVLAMRRIAVVGMSPNPNKPGHYVPAYLIDHGKDVVPVNPVCDQVLGRTCFPMLKDVPPPAIEVVLVFRRPEFCAEVAREAVAARARAIWLQTGIVSVEARQIANEAGLLYVEDRCMMVELSRASHG